MVLVVIQDNELVEVSMHTTHDSIVKYVGEKYQLTDQELQIFYDDGYLNYNNWPDDTIGDANKEFFVGNIDTISPVFLG